MDLATLSLTVLWRWLIGGACAQSALKQDAQNSTFRRRRGTGRVSNSQDSAVRQQASLQRKTQQTVGMIFITHTHRHVTQWFRPPPEL